MTDTTDGIRFLGDMTKLDMKPGDVAVLHCDRYLTVEQREWLFRELSAIFGDGKVLVLEKDMKLGVVRPPQKSNGPHEGGRGREG